METKKSINVIEENDKFNELELNAIAGGFSDGDKACTEFDCDDFLCNGYTCFEVNCPCFKCKVFTCQLTAS